MRDQCSERSRQPRPDYNNCAYLHTAAPRAVYGEPLTVTVYIRMICVTQINLVVLGTYIYLRPYRIYISYRGKSLIIQKLWVDIYT